MRLFRLFIIRRLLQERLRSGTTILGVALGVAVMVAIRLANASALEGFTTATEIVAGRTSLQLVGRGGRFDETLLGPLGWLREYGAVTAVIEGEALTDAGDGQGEALRVFGVDILRESPFRDYLLTGPSATSRTRDFLDLLIDSRSIVLTERLARLRGLSIGSPIELRIGDHRSRFIIRGLLRDEGPARLLDGRFALMDIAAAQAAFDRIGLLDRVELRLRDGVNLDRAEQDIAARLPPALVVQRPDVRIGQTEKMVAAFQANLTALSYVALLVGLFLVYNTVSISVIARRQEIGMLRALGLTRRRVVTLFLGEAIAFGLLGCVLGVWLGRLLANFSVRLTSTTMATLYMGNAASAPQLNVREAAWAFAVGLSLALLSAAVPAWEAARVPPMLAMRGDISERAYRLRPKSFLLPGVLLAGAGWLATQDPVDGLPLFGYAAAVLALFGAAFLVPATLYGVNRGLSMLLSRRFHLESWLANANLLAGIRRIAISVAALAVSLSMMVAIAVMIGSFRETVIYWIDQTLQADLYVASAVRASPREEGALSGEVERLIATHPDVAALDRFRRQDATYAGDIINLAAGDFSVLLDRSTLLFKAPANARAAMRAAIGHDAAVVSESFALKYGRGVGDVIVLQASQGPVRVSIAAVYYDYSSDQGVVVLDRGTFARYFTEQRPTGLTVYLRPGADAEKTRISLLERLGDEHAVRIQTNPGIRREALRVFDSTFAITYALEIIAIVVAIMGVIGTLLTLVLDRRRDLALLRLVGTERGRVRKMIVIEALAIGGVSQGIGIVVGFLLSIILVYVINVQSFGWTIQFHIPTAFLVRSTVGVLMATGLAGLYPAYRATRLDPLPQVAEE